MSRQVIKCIIYTVIIAKKKNEGRGIRRPDLGCKFRQDDSAFLDEMYCLKSQPCDCPGKELPRQRKHRVHRS